LLAGELSIGRWAEIAARAGLDAIDLSALFLTSREHSYLRAVAGDIRQSGMPLAVVNTYSDLTHPDADHRQKQAAELTRDIEAAAFLGAKMVRITAGQAHPNLDEEEAVRWVIDAFHRASETAGRNGILLVYENHSKPGVWKYPDFSHPSALFLKIARGIASTPVRILYDTANALARGEDPLALLGEVIDRVSCVHAADTAVSGKLKPVRIGEGIVPFDSIFRALKASGFDGCISIEEASSSGESALHQAVLFVKRTWTEAGQVLDEGKRNGKTGARKEKRT
jgi:sugar phosphate isomerase/epimerase